MTQKTSVPAYVPDKVAVFSDLHCGHILGLTPPAFQRNNNDAVSSLTREFWQWFDATAPRHPAYAIWNGDLIDGDGFRDSSHHLTTDPIQQTEIAIAVIKRVGAKKNIFVYGTPFHTGMVTDYESIIARHFDESIKYRQRISINGIRFDIMHTIGKTGTPVGGDLALKKSSIWSLIYDSMSGNEHADIIIRSHAHEYRFNGNDLMKAFITPALQLGYPDYYKYARRLDGWYNVGFLEFTISSNITPQQLFPEPHLFRYKIAGDYEII